MLNTFVKTFGLAIALVSLAACGGGDDPLPGDTSTDVVAKYIGSWESECYADGSYSARLQADFSKVSATSFSGRIVARGYLGKSCSGPSVKSQDVLTNIQMTHAGTKTVQGLQADKFNGSSTQGEGKLILNASATVLRVGDVKSAKDAEGYPTAFYSYQFTRR